MAHNRNNAEVSILAAQDWVQSMSTHVLLPQTLAGAYSHLLLEMSSESAVHSLVKSLSNTVFVNATK